MPLPLQGILFCGSVKTPTVLPWSIPTTRSASSSCGRPSRSQSHRPTLVKSDGFGVEGGTEDFSTTVTIPPSYPGQFRRAPSGSVGSTCSSPPSSQSHRPTLVNSDPDGCITLSDTQNH